MIRTFVGIELDEATRGLLADEIAYLKHAAPAVRWVAPENLHLTLKFVGDVRERDLPELLATVSEVTAQHDPFSLRVLGLGVFPRPDRPRVLWAGCAEGSDQATRLARDLEAACARIGYPPEKRPYRPHITLGRVKNPRDADEAILRIEDGANTDFDSTDVRSAVVFMSELTKSGAEYTPMHHAMLYQDNDL